jgi:hypothetical protein
MIKIDKLFKASLMSSLIPVFRDKFIFDDLYLSSRGFDIVINLITRKITDLDVGIYSTIFSYLNQDEFLGIKEMVVFKSIFESPVIWTELIRQKFIKYYLSDIKGYNWKDVFMGLLWYDQEISGSTNKDLPGSYDQEVSDLLNITSNLLVQELTDKNDYYDVYMGLSRDYPETKRYLIMNDLINIVPDYIDALIFHSDLDLVKHLLKDHTFNHVTIVDALYLSLDGKHPDVLEYLLNYGYEDENEYVDSDNEDSEQDMDLVIEELIERLTDERSAFSALTLSEFKVLENRINPKGDDIDRLISFALDFRELSEDTLNYIKSRLPETIGSFGAMIHLLQTINYVKIQMFELLYNKYKQDLTDKNIKELIDIINASMKECRYKNKAIYSQMLAVINK